MHVELLLVTVELVPVPETDEGEREADSGVEVDVVLKAMVAVARTVCGAAASRILSVPTDAPAVALERVHERLDDIASQLFVAEPVTEPDVGWNFA